MPGKVASTRVRAATRLSRVRRPHTCSTTLSPKAAPAASEGRGPKAGTVNDQRPSSRRPKGLASLLLFLGAHVPTVPAVPKALASTVIPKAMPTDANTRPNVVSAERQARTMRNMFSIIEEANRDYGTPHEQLSQ